jgi:flagellar basal-body rod protein FlgB
MALSELPMFGLVRRRLGWLGQRQEVIAQNIANSDTPKYNSRDLKAFDFKEVLREQRDPSRRGVVLATNHPRHIEKQGGGENEGPFKVSQDRRPYETAPDGNQVVLEEQMVKMNETQATHNVMTQLYKKHMAFFKSVSRSSGGAA